MYDFYDLLFENDYGLKLYLFDYLIDAIRHKAERIDEFSLNVKEDIEALLLALSPILYIFHQDIPKPHVLHPNIIQNLAIKPETLKLLPLLGWLPNDAGEYCYCDTELSHEIAHRQKAAREFRKFYNELATVKNRQPNQLEHFLSVSCLNID
ncbi:unnamed protein product [Rotaria sp. Silwood1]|nr:unnamed protein product [Rotaria sp. Silwood1]CAF1627246.1 unnamed protein product [Rotaria sp. Silwood1]